MLSNNRESSLVVPLGASPKHVVHIALDLHSDVLAACAVFVLCLPLPSLTHHHCLCGDDRNNKDTKPMQTHINETRQKGTVKEGMMGNCRFDFSTSRLLGCIQLTFF